MAYTKYSLTPANNNAAPPDGAPEGMLPSAVNDTMRDMMAQIRDVGDGIRDGTYPFTSGTVISANTSTNALRITQEGTGNALLVEDSTNPDSTPFVISNDGNVINGYTTGISVQTFNGTNVNARYFQAGTGYAGSGLTTSLWNATSSACGTFNFAKSSNATIGTNQVVVSGENLGAISFAGADGTNFISAAAIFATVDGTPGTNDMPGRLVFSTTADGASSPTERMRIDSSGNVGIGAIAPAVKLEISANNTGITTNAGNNTLRLTDTDTTVADNQPIGSIEFYGSDAGGAGAGVKARIVARSEGTAGQTELAFHTADGVTNDIERLRITNAGLVTLTSGSGLSISATAVTAPATGDGNVFSGTYTPTLSNTTNVASSTASELQYMRVGSVVTVSGLVAITPTAASDTNTVLRMSLPISSDFSGTTNLGGTGVISSSAGRGVAAAIYANTTTDNAEFNFLSPSTSALSFRFTFTYRIL
jgi:hypothetical protein